MFDKRNLNLTWLRFHDSMITPWAKNHITILKLKGIQVLLENSFPKYTRWWHPSRMGFGILSTFRRVLGSALRFWNTKKLFLWSKSKLPNLGECWLFSGGFPTLNHQYLFSKNSINLTSAQKNFHPMIWGIRADQTKKCPHFVHGKWYSSWFLPLPQLQPLNSRCPPLLSMLTAVSSNSMVSKPCHAGEGDIVGVKHGVNCCPVFWWICQKESHKNPLSEVFGFQHWRSQEIWGTLGSLRFPAVRIEMMFFRQASRCHLF